VTGRSAAALGATPLALGRALVTSEDSNDIISKGIVIGHDVWQRRFNGDPGVIAGG
jgi:hypothetical protein